MSPKIEASSFLSRHFLVVKDTSVLFYKSGQFGGKKFRYEDIDCVLLATNQELSFQVRREVFSIPTNPRKPRHVRAIELLVAKVRETLPPAPPAPPVIAPPLLSPPPA